jgi:hypothetical protein
MELFVKQDYLNYNNDSIKRIKKYLIEKKCGEFIESNNLNDLKQN